MKEKITYEWHWRILALFQNTKRLDGSGGSSQRLFSFWPPIVWGTIKYKWLMWRHGGDPFAACEKWLKQNGHWDDEDFMRAVTWWYGNHSEPGQLVKLNPRLLK